jgi:hypothetical protein
MKNAIIVTANIVPNTDSCHPNDRGATFQKMAFFMAAYIPMLFYHGLQQWDGWCDKFAYVYWTKNESTGFPAELF